MNVDTTTQGDYMLLLGHQLGKDISGISVVPQEREVLFDSALRHLISAIDEHYENGKLVRYVNTDEVLPNTVNIHFTHL